MITEKNDDCSFGQAKSIQCVQQPAHLRIHKRNRGPICLDAGAELLLVNAPPRPRIRRSERGGRKLLRIIEGTARNLYLLQGI